jgi:hypothetical protein
MAQAGIENRAFGANAERCDRHGHCRVGTAGIILRLLRKGLSDVADLPLFGSIAPKAQFIV